MTAALRMYHLSHDKLIASILWRPLVVLTQKLTGKSSYKMLFLNILVQFGIALSKYLRLYLSK